jgi:hypothetical protein
MRPVYVSKLFALLRWLEVPQHAIARQLGANESSVSMWANGQRALPKRHVDAFLEFASTTILQAYAPLKATFAAGIARAQPLPEIVSPPDLAHGPAFDGVELSSLLLIEGALPEGDPLKQEFQKALKRVWDIKQCLDNWQRELAEGDGSLYHEFAEAVKTLRPYMFMNEEELRLALTPEARQAAWKACNTGTWCMRTLDELGPVPEVEQLRKQMTPQAQQSEPSRPTPERSRRTPVGSHSSR